MLHTEITLITSNRSIYIIKDKTSQKCFIRAAYIVPDCSIRVKGSVTALLESLTALLEYFNLLQYLKSVSLVFTGSRALKHLNY